MNVENARSFAYGLAFVAIQVILFRHLKIFGVQPDLVLIFVLWYMTRKDRTSAIIMAAVLGFTQDAMLDLWGLNMFSKVLTAFVGFRFIPKEGNAALSIIQVTIVVFIASLIHNLIFLGLNVVVEIYAAEMLFWRQWIGSAIYTSILAGFVHIFRTR